MPNTEDEMLPDRNMQRTELSLTKRLPEDGIQILKYSALLEMNIEAPHNSQVVVNKLCDLGGKSEMDCGRGESSLESGNVRILSDCQTSTQLVQQAETTNLQPRWIQPRDWKVNL